jgi:peptidoglycan/LPS O-acetylase OafA/YrhL
LPITKQHFLQLRQRYPGSCKITCELSWTSGFRTSGLHASQRELTEWICFAGWQSFRIDESRQRASAHRQISHGGSALPTDWGAGVERSARGVIFFAISGFLITTTALRRWGRLSQVSLRGFYLMRFARIAPLLILLLAILSTLHFARLCDFVVTAKTGGLSRALFAALTFHVNLLEANRGYLPGNWDILWSLSVEEMFYLFFPLLSRLFTRVTLFIPFLAAFVLLGPFARTYLAHGNQLWKEYSYLGGMDAIALGSLTALASAQFPLSRGTLRGVAAQARLSPFLFFVLPRSP